jgi:hypothetical protein
MNRSASCSWREVPVPIVRFRPLLTRPKLAGEVRVVPGLPACVRFEHVERLNAEHERLVFHDGIRFCSAKSTCASPGPTAMARPALPHVFHCRNGEGGRIQPLREGGSAGRVDGNARDQVRALPRRVAVRHVAAGASGDADGQHAAGARGMMPLTSQPPRTLKRSRR